MKIKLYKPFEHWYHGGTIYLYSDPHFQTDTEMEQYFNWPTAEERLALINKYVTKNDTFICLGDVGDRLELVSKIKCDYKVLITGNHDKGVSNYIRKEIFIDWMWPNEAKYGCLMHPEWYVKDFNKSKVGVYYKSGYFDEVYDGLLFISDKIVLSHERVELPFAINIHGHEHTQPFMEEKELKRYDETYKTYLFNLAADAIDFKPKRLDEIVALAPLNGITSIHRMTIDNAAKEIENET